MGCVTIGRLTGAAAFLALLLLAACSVAPDRGHVQKEWNLTLRELGVSPVFPPREDVHVGDVYLRSGDPSDEEVLERKGFVPLDLWVAGLPLRAEASGFYRRRPSYPDRAEPPAPSDAEQPPEPPWGPPAHADHGAGDDVFTHLDRTRLRQVAFPDFASMVVRGADLQGFLPVQAMSIAFGASWRATHTLSVKIPAAESVGLPANLVLPHVIERRPAGRGDVFLRPAVLPAELLVLLRAEQEHGQDDEEEDVLFLDVVTEVFYARALEISVSRQETAGARVRVEPVTPVPGGAGVPAPELGPEPQPEPEPTPEGGTAPQEGPQPDAITRAEILNQRLALVDEQGGVGGTVQFLAASDHSVAMRRTFLRPVAVGFRGVTLRVQATTGRVLGLRPAESVAATTAGASERLRRILSSVLNRFFEDQGKEHEVEYAPEATDSLVFTVRPGTDVEQLQDDVRDPASLAKLSALLHRALRQSVATTLTPEEQATLEDFRRGTFIFRRRKQDG